MTLTQEIANDLKCCHPDWIQQTLDQIKRHTDDKLSVCSSRRPIAVLVRLAMS
jgi:hypothetical protein